MAELEWTQVCGTVWNATASSAQVFFDTLRRSNDAWWDTGRNPWVFRGHSDANWKLLPAAWRERQPLITACKAEAYRRIKRVNPQQSMRWLWGNHISGETVLSDNDLNLGLHLTAAATAELIPLFEFTTECTNLGISTPLDGSVHDVSLDADWLWESAHPLVGDNFVRFQNFLEGAAVAQHYGLPTRLLDWTLSPAAAMFFAVDDAIARQAKTDIAVWCLNRSAVELISLPGHSFPNGGNQVPVPIQVAVVRPSIRDNPNLIAQSGLFTCVVASGIHFMKNDGERPALDELVSLADNPGPVLKKLTLRYEEVPALAEILRRERMVRSALMPSRDNVALDVKRRWIK